MMTKAGKTVAAFKEGLGCLWLATLAVAACAVCAVSVWFALPREPVIYLGQLEDFPPNQPVHRVLDADLAVYVVNLEGQLIAWDTQPALPRVCSRIKWITASNRFEDPCSGAKWCLDGTIADTRFVDVRSLDRYALEVTGDGAVYLHRFEKIAGSPLQEEAGLIANSSRFPPQGIYNCRHLSPDNSS